MAGDDSSLKTSERDKDGRARVRVFGIALLAILAFVLFPAVSVAIAVLVANAAGCALNEAAAYPCVIAGVDLGHHLYRMQVLGWLMLGTIPLGGLLLVCWTVALAVVLGIQAFRR